MKSRIEQRIFYYNNPSNNKILLVGDKPGKKALTEVPFASDKYSGGWLNKKLETPEDELQWINTADKDGNLTSFCLLQTKLPAKVIIALGKNASQWLKSFNLEFLEVPHPSYWKRFHNDKPYPLIEIMRSYKNL